MNKLKNNFLYAGVDEAGRGPLAGPVMAAAVILNPEKPIMGLKDSKLLSPQKRESLAILIKSHAVAYGIGRAEVSEIDQLNILQASLLAMTRAVHALCEIISPTLILVDGMHCPEDIGLPMHAIIKGDRLIPAISAAAILAKTTRDAEMCRYDQQYPGYQFSIHKGYPTKKHRWLIQQLGICPLHRRSFKC